MYENNNHKLRDKTMLL